MFRHQLFKIVLSYPCLDFLTTSFLYLVVTLALKQNTRSNIGLQIRPLGAFTAFRTLLPSADCSAELSDQAADSNGRSANFFKLLKQANSYDCQQPAVSPGLGSSNLKKMRQTAITNCKRAVTPNWVGSIAPENISQCFFQRQRNPMRIEKSCRKA
jgi:hypothetical protein